MPLLSSLLKSPTSPQQTRAVPHGGLGGMVNLTENTRNEGAGGERQRGVGGKTKRKPTPIEVHNVGVMQPPLRTAPVKGRDQEVIQQSFWDALHPSMRSASALAFVLTKYEKRPVLEPSPRFNDPWSNVRRKPTEGQQITNRHTGLPKRPPAELPGSILLPSQGLRPYTYVPFSSPNPERWRSNSDSSINSTSQESDVSSASKYSTATEDSFRPAVPEKSPVLGARLKVPEPSLPGSTRHQVLTPNAEITITQSINTLTALDLIRIMTAMPSNKLMSDWLPAMMKEMDKYKSLLASYSQQSQHNARDLRAIIDELQTLVGRLKDKAQHAGEFFEKAQADVDHRKRTDLEKLHDAEEQLHVALLTCTQKKRHNHASDHEDESLQLIIHEVLRTIGDCVRNNFALRLFECKALTPEVVRKLQEFKKSDESLTESLAKTVPAEVCDELYRKLQEMNHSLDDCQDMIREQREALLSNEATCDRLERRHVEQAQELLKVRREVAEKDEIIRELHRKNQVLSQRISTVIGSDITRKISDTTVCMEGSGEVSPDIQILLETHQTQIKDRDSRLVHQNAMIEDLLRQINELSKRSGSVSSTASSKSVTPPPLYSLHSVPSRTEATRQMESFSVVKDAKEAKKKERRSRLTIRSLIPGARNNAKTKQSLLSPRNPDDLSPGRTPSAHSGGSSTSLLSPWSTASVQTIQFRSPNYEQGELTPTPASYFAQTHYDPNQQGHPPQADTNSPLVSPTALPLPLTPIPPLSPMNRGFTHTSYQPNVNIGSVVASQEPPLREVLQHQPQPQRPNMTTFPSFPDVSARLPNEKSVFEDDSDTISFVTIKCPDVEEDTDDSDNDADDSDSEDEWARRFGGHVNPLHAHQMYLNNGGHRRSSAHTLSSRTRSRDRGNPKHVRRSIDSGEWEWNKNDSGKWEWNPHVTTRLPSSSDGVGVGIVDDRHHSVSVTGSISHHYPHHHHQQDGGKFGQWAWQWKDEDIGHGLQSEDLSAYDARLKMRLMSV